MLDGFYCKRLDKWSRVSVYSKIQENATHSGISNFFFFFLTKHVKTKLDKFCDLYFSDYFRQIQPLFESFNFTVNALV